MLEKAFSSTAAIFSLCGLIAFYIAAQAVLAESLFASCNEEGSN
eukprot:SAG31_NODE_43240_length_268_cov_0.603550_1_plen_43_part_10